MHRILAIFLLTLLSLAYAAEPLALTRDGKPNASIVVDPALKGNPTVDLAVKELVHWVKEISGAELTASGMPVTVCLTLDAKQFPKEAQSLAGTDGYAIRLKDNTVYLIAARPRGLLNAVHQLLYRNTDIIWARPHLDFGTVFTPTKTILLSNCNVIDVPVFTMRGWQIGVGDISKNRKLYDANEYWQLRNGSCWTAGLDREKILFDYDRSFGGGHNLIGLYIKPSKYWKTHPEYYSQLNGKLTDPRDHKLLTQLCFTNPELLKTFIAEMDGHIQKHLGAKTIRVSIEDNYLLCECPQCLKDITLPDGTVLKGDAPRNSAEWMKHRNTQYFMWLNEIAKDFKKKYPDKRLLSFAYFFSEPAPLIPIEDNIDLSFCPITKDSRYSVMYPQNKVTYDKLMAWLRRTLPANIIWREYYGLSTEFPRPDDWVAFEDLRFASSYGMTRTYSEMALDYGHTWRKGDIIWDFNAPYFWNLTNAVWNPFRDCYALRREFFTRCYGTAALEMEEVFRTFEKLWSYNQVPSRWDDKSQALWVMACQHPEEIDTIQKLLDAALAKCNKPNGKIMIQRLKDAVKSHIVEPSSMRIVAKKTATPPPFDPTLSKGPWASAPAYTEFEKCPYRTTVKMLYDDKNLYVAMHAEDPGIKARRDAAFKNVQLSALNFFFEITDPNTYQSNAFHYLVDPWGYTWSSLSGNKKLPIKWAHKEEVNDNDWTILITVPREPMKEPYNVAFFRRYAKKHWPNDAYGLKGTLMHSFYTFLPLILE